MKISNQEINGENGAFIIAEIGQAHDGSLGMAHSFIEAVAAAGANAIKFQTHIAKAESTLDEPFRVPLSGQDENRFQYWKRMEFTEEQWQDLANHAKKRNLIFLSSPFSIEAVVLLSKIGMPAWKIGSGEVFNYPLIDQIIQKGDPILLSSGMSNWDQITKSVEYIQNRGANLALFQCTSKYPTSLDEIGLNILEEIKSRYNNVPNGLSDHSGTLWPSLAALSQEVDFIEVHVTFDKGMYGPDSSSSINFKELKLICEANKAFTKMRQNPIDKDLFSKEITGTKSLFTKSLSPKYDLPIGTIIEEEMISLKKPSGGLTMEEINKIKGKKLKKPLSSNHIIKHEDLKNIF